MHKKLAAALTISIFIISMFTVMTPVQAHFTLGDLTGTYRYHDNDFDPHVPGLVGYVWPGAGQNTWEGYPDLGSNSLSPGYQSPYPGGNPPWAGGEDSPANWLQLEGHEYAPFGGVLTGSTGDLIFAITEEHFGEQFAAGSEYDAWWILIPPEFAGIVHEQIVTTVTNDYAKISKYTLGPNDRYAPGWTFVGISADPQQALTFGGGEWYYARINGVTAPMVAGRYFFKMGVGTGHYPHAETEPGIISTDFVPVQNWPVMLVKGEVDPAIITGTIRYGGYNATLYGEPIQEAGRVWAHMTAKIDPYTNNKMFDCPSVTSPWEVNPLATNGCVDALGYFNATAMGHYEVEGVAPGVYDLYASAAGFPQELIATGVTVLKGQSLHFEGYLNPGVVIHGNVYSKHQFGEEPWLGTNGENAYIKIELYDQPTVNHLPADDVVPVSWSPLPCVAGGQDVYHGGNHAGECGDPRTAGRIAFPWHEYIAGGLSQVSDSEAAGANDETDPMGVGPLQNWFVEGGTTTPFHFEFGAKGMYGAPRDADGHVPQEFATWVNGLTPGRYYVRAWVFRYVQSALDGSTFQEYYFDVTPKEWAGDVTLPIDLRLSSWVNKVVHFHDRAGTISTDPISTGAQFLIGMLQDDAGVIWAHNVTDVDDQMDSQTISLYGWNDTWSGENYGIPTGTYTPYVYVLGYVQQTFERVSVTLSGTPTYISDHLYRGAGFNLTLYSIDWERPRINRNWVWPDKEIEIAIFDSTGAQIGAICDWCNNNFPDGWENPKQDTDTYAIEVEGGGTGTAHGVFFGSEALYALEGGRNARIWFFNRGGKLHRPSTYVPSSFESGQYSFRGWTYGYIQNKDFTVYANKGEIADIKLNLIIGVNVTVDILFKKERIITPTAADMSARVRLFDDSGNLLATWMSSQGVYVTHTDSVTNAVAADNSELYPWEGAESINYLPSGITLLHVNLAGLPIPFWGDPIFTGGGGNFEIDNWADGIATHFRNGGIPGSPDYTGSYTVEVDFVNWYSNVVADHEHERIWYPPVPGLLQGESCHWIVGATVPADAVSCNGFTEQGALDPFFLGHSMAPNHLGPYRQEGPWVLSNAHNSGESSGVFEVDLNGLISGNALAFTWSAEFRPVSWARVELSGVPGGTYVGYSWDGTYEFYSAPSDTAMLTISIPGYEELSTSISVTDGMATSGQNWYLEMSGIPVPEFSGIAVVAFSALAASLYLLRRRRR